MRDLASCFCICWRLSPGSLRTLRELELSGSGNTTKDAIRAALLQISGVLTCTVFSNDTNVTDAVGMPPHSVEVLVRTSWVAADPLDQLICDAAARERLGRDRDHREHLGHRDRRTGHRAHGQILPTHAGSGVRGDRGHLRPATYPADGDTQIQDAIVLWGGAQASGKDAVSCAIRAQEFSVDGVDDVTHTYIDVAPSPTLATTIAISLRQLATCDTSRIVVTSTPGTP